MLAIFRNLWRRLGVESSLECFISLLLCLSALLKCVTNRMQWLVACCYLRDWWIANISSEETEVDSSRCEKIPVYNGRLQEKSFT